MQNTQAFQACDWAVAEKNPPSTAFLACDWLGSQQPTSEVTNQPLRVRDEENSDFFLS